WGGGGRGHGGGGDVAVNRVLCGWGGHSGGGGRVVSAGPAAPGSPASCEPVVVAVGGRVVCDGVRARLRTDAVAGFGGAGGAQPRARWPRPPRHSGGGDSGCGGGGEHGPR